MRGILILNTVIFIQKTMILVAYYAYKEGIFSMKAVLAATCTLGNNKNDLKDLCSPKSKQPRYKALFLGTGKSFVNT